MFHWAAACFILALIAGYGGYPGVAQDMAFNGTILAIAGVIMAVTSYLVQRRRKV